MIKRLEALQKFLKSLNNLRQQGLIKSVDQAVAFAKQEFGEVNDLLKRQIEQVFKGTTSKAPPPGGGGITSIKNAPKKETPDQASGIMASEEASPLMQKLEKGAETLRGFKQPGMDLTTGMARTAARVILDNAGIKVPEKVDPLEVIAKEFGGDVLMDLKDVAEELIEKERTGKITESMGEFLESRGMFNLQRGRTDAPQGMSDEELEQIKKQVDQEKMLKDFDPKDRTENSEGGINRVGYKIGSGKSLIKFLKGKDNLVKKIKQAVDDIFTTDDIKYDADVAVDTMLEDLGVDRTMFDQKEILDAYGLAYDEITRPLLKELKNKPKPSPKKTMNTELDEMNMKYEGEEFDRLYDDYLYYKNEEGNFTGSFEDFIKARRQAGSLDAEMIKLKKLGAPKMAERFELKQRFPGIDDKLLTQIIDDPNPQNKAEAIATLDQAMELTKQGKDPDEIISVLEKIKNSRKDNARGGLQYLMGM